jgi:hypothetical protein
MEDMFGRQLLKLYLRTQNVRIEIEMSQDQLQ